MENVYKVLIVEDDPMVAMINAQYVERNTGFKIVGRCRNGKEALNFFENDTADLVILDVYMPYMNGVELLQRLREKQIGVEVVMVTAANDSATLENTMHLGVLDYLVKPFAYERFQVALEKFCVKKGAFQNNKIFDQRNIDNIISGVSAPKAKELPKGIQEKTLDLIMEQLDGSDSWLDGDAIAKATGLSLVTVRRYMNFLVKDGRAAEDINYDTGGRPCMLYRRKR
ncbi:MAG TPA: response regulator [Treponema sp.]|jgi:response regulator of citrate/malate metabolism|nr:response regulator [Treponema sp.]